MLEIKEEKSQFPRIVDRVANYNKIVVQYRQRKGWQFSIRLVMARGATSRYHRGPDHCLERALIYLLT